MPLSLDSIYHPFNEFFSQKFATGVDAPVAFRFAHLPRTFADSDFLTPLHPDWGPSPALAEELLSSVVDGVPRLDDDGRTVWLSMSRLSELYADEILGPSIPFVPPEVTDETEKQALIDAFISTKGSATGLWENGKAASLEGGGAQFHPATAMPANWWNKADTGVWTHQSFQVKGAATTPGQPAQVSDRLLRMKVDDNTLRAVLQSHVAASPPVQPSPAPHPAVMLSRRTMVMARPVFTAALASDAARAKPAPVAPELRSRLAIERPPATVAIHDEVTPRISTLPFRQRMEIQAVLASNAQTQAVVTNDVTISFDYCVVNVARPWLHQAFINNHSWWIPGQHKGQLSANDGHGLPSLPVGFIAIKGLSIKAPWTPEDITNLGQSVQFGPFNFDSKVVDGAISHEGIQIVGWMLQKLPDLPPNGAGA